MHLIISHNPYFNRWFSAIVRRFKIPNMEYMVTILILIDGFLQFGIPLSNTRVKTKVTILILIDGFLQYKQCSEWETMPKVTILILIDGFLQYVNCYNQSVFYNKVTILILIDGFLQLKV